MGISYKVLLIRLMLIYCQIDGLDSLLESRAFVQCFCDCFSNFWSSCKVHCDVTNVVFGKLFVDLANCLSCLPTKLFHFVGVKLDMCVQFSQEDTRVFAEYVDNGPFHSGLVGRFFKVFFWLLFFVLIVIVRFVGIIGIVDKWLNFASLTTTHAIFHR